MHCTAKHPSTIGDLRKSGIEIIGDVPWGTHFCQFYQTDQDLIDTLVPYFKAGLHANEFCMWVTSEPLDVEDARQALRKAVPDLDRRIEEGQMEIMPYTEWYLLGGTFDQQRVLDGWVRKLDNAVAKGYTGLRLNGNTFWLEKDDWQDFTDYEEAVNSVIGNYHMLALCTYSVDMCGAGEVADVVANHEFAIMKRRGRWTVIESSTVKQAKQELEAANEVLLATENELRNEIEERKCVEQALRESEAQLRTIVDNLTEGLIVSDLEGKLLHWNRTAVKMHSFTSEEEGLQRLPEFVDTFELSIDNTVLQVDQWPLARILRGEDIRDLEIDIRRIDVDWQRVFSYGGTLVRDTDGQPLIAVVTVNDVTERAQLEKHRHDLYERERHISDVLQKALVPDELEHYDGCDIAVRYEAALREAEVGGDFYDVFDCGNGRIGVVIGDVAGKGLTAAIRVAAARHSIRSYAYTHSDPGDVLTLANNALCKYTGDSASMLTAFFAIVDRTTGKMTYANGGHELPWLRHSDGTVETLDVSGRAMGILEDYEYSSAAMHFKPGDLVVLATDGITEARPDSTNLFGTARVIDYLLNSRCENADCLAGGLLAAAKQHAGGHLSDDAAIVVFGLTEDKGDTK